MRPKSVASFPGFSFEVCNKALDLVVSTSLCSIGGSAATLAGLVKTRELASTL